ncbi:MAG: 30S ribosomal protein S20, partial [Clostridia bacterium]|nr:30S ribosomal protein S20 [Clostridia bacterium]
MPNIKSAKKRVKITEAKTLQNKMFKNRMRTTIKKFLA